MYVFFLGIFHEHYPFCPQTWGKQGKNLLLLLFKQLCCWFVHKSKIKSWCLYSDLVLSIIIILLWYIILPRKKKNGLQQKVRNATLDPRHLFHLKWHSEALSPLIKIPFCSTKTRDQGCPNKSSVNVLKPLLSAPLSRGCNHSVAEA